MLRRGRRPQLRFCARSDDAPSAPAAYVLRVDLVEPISVRVAGKSPTELPAGRYLYCGSARRQRATRATRASRQVTRWHVDQLTERGVITGIWVARDGHECDLVEMLSSLPMPVRGFGRTDCSRCKSHLLHWPNGRTAPLGLDGARSRRITGSRQTLGRGEYPFEPVITEASIHSLARER